MGVYDQRDIRFAIVQRTLQCYFRGEVAKIGLLHLHSLHWHFTVIAMLMEDVTSERNELCPVSLEFTRLDRVLKGQNCAILQALCP